MVVVVVVVMMMVMVGDSVSGPYDDVCGLGPKRKQGG
jgi:hypothetical protein